jgi:hypothetical protein
VVLRFTVTVTCSVASTVWNCNFEHFRVGKQYVIRSKDSWHNDNESVYLPKKYAERDGSEVVPRVAQILKRRWDAAASMTVDELEVGCGDFKVVEPISIVDENGDDNVQRIARSYGDPDRVLVVKPYLEWCSCGVWQDFLYPYG